MAEPAADHRLRPIGVDRPGMGLSQYQSHRRVRDWHHDVTELADRLGIGSFAVAGFSGGGPYALRAEILGAPSASAATDAENLVSAVNSLPSGSALLVIKRGPNAGARFALDQPVAAAGRHPGRSIYLDDVTVSRHHAEFRVENGTFCVVDVGSLNGTYVNREPVESAPLADGDEIQISKFRLLFTQP